MYIVYIGNVKINKIIIYCCSFHNINLDIMKYVLKMKIVKWTNENV